MKIEKNGEKVKFVDMWYGDCFMYDNDYFMKVSGGYPYNAVNLQEGEACGFDEGDMVFPVKAKVVIE